MPELIATVVMINKKVMLEMLFGQGRIDSGIQLHQHQSCYVMSTRQSLLNMNYLNESEDNKLEITFKTIRTDVLLCDSPRNVTKKT